MGDSLKSCNRLMMAQVLHMDPGFPGTTSVECFLFCFVSLLKYKTMLFTIMIFFKIIYFVVITFRQLLSFLTVLLPTNFTRSCYSDCDIPFCAKFGDCFINTQWPKVNTIF